MKFLSNTLFSLVILALVILNFALTDLVLHGIFTILLAATVVTWICTSRLKDGVPKSITD